MKKIAEKLATLSEMLFVKLLPSPRWERGGGERDDSVSD